MKKFRGQRCRSLRRAGAGRGADRRLRRQRRRGARAAAEAGAADLAPVKSYLTDHSADLVEQVGPAEGERGRVLRAGRSRSTSTTQRLLDRARRGSRADPRRLQGRLRRRQPGLRGDGGDRRRGAAAGPLRRRHRRRLRRLDARRRGLLQPDHARRRAAEAAGQPLLPDRDRALRHQPRPGGQGRRSPTSTATARSSSARACPTPTSTRRRWTNSTGRRRASTKTRRSSNRRRPTR